METRSVTDTRNIIAQILEGTQTHGGINLAIPNLYTALNEASANCPGRMDPSDSVRDVDETAMLPITQSDAFIARAQEIANDFRAAVAI